MKIGIPQKKLTRQKNTAKKHSAPLEKFLQEAFKERYSRSKTLNRDNSIFNIYKYPDGVKTTRELNTWFEQEFENYWAENGQKKADGTVKKSRKDAVVAIGYIIKPTAADMNKLPKDDQEKLLLEALDEYEKITGLNTDAYAIHADEDGLHLHGFARPINDKGKYKANDFMSRKALRKINDNFPKAMRDLGWEIDNYSLDEETKKARHGLDVNEYTLEQDQKKLAKTSENIKHAKALESSLSSEITKLSIDKEREIKTLVAAQEELQKTEDERASKEMDKGILVCEEKDLIKKINSLNSKKTELNNEINTLKKSQKPLKNKLETEINTLNSEKNELKNELETIEKSIPVKKNELAKIDNEIDNKKPYLENLKSNIDDLEYEEKNLNSNISYLKKLNADLNKNILGLFWKIFDKVFALFQKLEPYAKSDFDLLDFIKAGKTDWIKDRLNPNQIIKEYADELYEEQEYER